MKNKILLILILITFVFVLSNVLYINADKGSFDSDTHFLWALDYNRVLFDHNNTLSTENIRSLRYPPFVYLITQSFFMLAGKTIFAARLSLLPFWIIFVFAVFGIAEKAGGKASGFLVLGLVLTSPHILNVSRSYLLDFPQIAMTAAALLFLLKSDYFSERKYSLLFGITAGLAVVTKWASLYVLVMPVLIYTIITLVRNRISLKAIKINFLPFVTVPICFIMVYGNSLKNPMSIDNLWFPQFILLVLIPCALSIYSCWKNYSGISDNPDRVFLNLTTGFSLFSVISMPWLLWAASSLLVKVRSDMEFIAIYNTSRELISNFAVTFFITPWFWIIIAAGLISAIVSIKKNAAIFGLLMSATLFFSAFSYVTTLYRDPRYILSLFILIPIFAAFIPLSEKIKYIASCLFIPLFLFAGFSWMDKTSNQRQFVPVDRAGNYVKSNKAILYVSEKPRIFVSKTDELVEAIRNIKLNSSVPLSISIYQYRLHLQLRDQLIWQVNYIKKYGWNFNEIPQSYAPRELFSSDFLKRMNPKPVVVVVYDKNDMEGLRNWYYFVIPGEYSHLGDFCLGGGITACVYVPPDVRQPTDPMSMNH